MNNRGGKPVYTAYNQTSKEVIDMKTNSKQSMVIKHERAVHKREHKNMLAKLELRSIVNAKRSTI